MPVRFKMEVKNTELKSLLAPLLHIPHSAHPDKLQWLPVEFLQRGQYQPRKEFKPESLQELAESISAQGIIQPIVVRKLSAEKFEIIAGERRWRAAQLAGLEKVPVVVKQLDEKAAMAIALIENIQREDLNPLEEAEALKKLLDAFTMTHQELAETVGKSRSAVTNLIRLLDLAPPVKALIIQGQLSAGHARALLPLNAALQLQLAQKIVQQNLSVRAAELLVKQAQESKKNLLNKIIDRDTLHLQQSLSEKLNAKVEIKHKKNGSGQLLISYSSLEELDGILQQFN
jgi:ParB family transcriptional regulator, chromosome partitioning protein